MARTYGGHVENAFDEVRRSIWVERLARTGFAVKGLVYFIIGALAVMAALSRGGETVSQKGAISRIAEQPFGQVLLGIVAGGLLFYAFWRFMTAFADSEHKGSGTKAIIERTGYFFSAIVYASLALYAAQILMGAGGSSADGTKTWVAWLMSKPFGPGLVGLAGVAALGVGIAQFWKAHNESFRDNLRLSEMNEVEEQWATRAGKWGYAARGVVFLLTGVFLLTAATTQNPSEARGLEGALDTLARQPYGSWLLAVVAAGLAAYGAYMFVEAKYRRVHL